MAVHMRNGIQYGGIPNGTVKGTTPSTVPTTVKQLNQIGTVGDIAPVTIPSAVKFSNGNTLETAIGSVATIETSPAVATHAVGDYVFYNGQMYKVIAAIAVGETLTADTNIEATSVGEELTALNNGLTTKGIGFTFGAISAYGVETQTVDISANPAKLRHIVGWALSDTTFLVPIQLFFSDKNKITCRVTNFTSNALSAGVRLTVYYV